ncbi:unnamed protein product [Tilletia controversa]|nr:unnamed protein product [Tilletia controversa]CAD6975850.1 unnamed protein product [Tilletia controversa]
MRSLAQTEKEIDEDSNPRFYGDNPHIKIHPILSRIRWDVCLDDDDDDDDEDDGDDDDSTFEEVFVVNSGLKMKDVPHILNECATCPPVSAFGVDRELFTINKYSCEIPFPQSDSTSTPHNNQRKQQPALVRDVVKFLLEAAVGVYFKRNYRSLQRMAFGGFNEYVNTPMDFKATCQCVTIRCDGLLLDFNFE